MGLEVRCKAHGHLSPREEKPAGLQCIPGLGRGQSENQDKRGERESGLDNYLGLVLDRSVTSLPLYTLIQCVL